MHHSGSDDGGKVLHDGGEGLWICRTQGHEGQLDHSLRNETMLVL